MDTQELKMILEALSGVSGDAKSVLVLFFWTTIVGWAINWLIVLTVAWMVTRTIRFAITHASFTSHALSYAGYDPESRRDRAIYLAEVSRLVKEGNFETGPRL